MVKLGNRAPSRNILDRRRKRPRAPRPSNTGPMIGYGLAGSILLGGLGVAVTSVNQVLEYIGIERRLPAPTSSLSEPRRVEIDAFAAVVLGDTERIWSTEFERYGVDYPAPTLVFYDEQTPSGCGAILSSFGPVYCAFDRRIFIDLTFFDAVAGRFGVKGDFPPAYILAHEVAHHVQMLTGDMDIFFDRLQSRAEPANQLQVRFELQADCFAGVWTKKADKEFGLLEAGDLSEAITAARAFGDDSLQRVERGVIDESSFTHGSGAQRARWFLKGYEHGEIAGCDTWTQAYGDL